VAGWTGENERWQDGPGRMKGGRMDLGE